MQRFLACTTVLTMAWLGAIGVAQTKIATAEEYGAVMRATAQAFGGVTNTMSAGLFADARTPLAEVREGLVALEGFWTERKRDDAVAIVTRALERVDALDRLLAEGKPSRSDTLALAKEIQGACASCHEAYREGDNQSGFRFKAGVL